MTGRTTPGVFSCEDANGNPAGEYVVKLKGNIETGNAGLLREIVGNLLAEEVGIAAPEPAIVDIPVDLAGSISDMRVAQSVQKSIGLNFGSKNLSGGYYAWPNEKTVPPSLKQLATDIFVFDALIQNPDRRRGKPNLLWKSDGLVAIDHEMAFSFLLALFPSKQPWLLADQPYLGDHIFFHHLRGTEVDLSRITGAIEAVKDTFWNELDGVVPADWKGTELARIHNHVESIQEHLEEFMNDVRRILQ